MDKNWNHEEMSIRLLDDIIDYSGFNITTDELEVAKEMIVGRENFVGENGYYFLFSLALSNIT